MSTPPPGVEVDHAEFLAGTIRYYRCSGGTDESDRAAPATGPREHTPVVLLHGGGVNNALLSWRHTLAALAPEYPAYAPDLPGQGASIPWYGRTNQRTYEESLRWLLDDWQTEHVTLVGLSMGASIATGFATRHPERVRGLVLVDPMGMQSRRRHQTLLYTAIHARLFGRLAALSLRAPRPVRRRVANTLLFTGGTELADANDILDELRTEARRRRSTFGDWHRQAVGPRAMRTNLLPQLHQVRCPSLVMHGERDRVISQAVAQAAAEALDCPLRIIAGAGHWPSRERPEDFTAALRTFLAGDT